MHCPNSPLNIRDKIILSIAFIVVWSVGLLAIRESFINKGSKHETGATNTIHSYSHSVEYMGEVLGCGIYEITTVKEGSDHIETIKHVLSKCPNDIETLSKIPDKASNKD